MTTSPRLAAQLDWSSTGEFRPEKFIGERKPDYFTYADWKRLDDLEQANGKACGRPRLKFTSVEEMRKALGK